MNREIAGSFALQEVDVVDLQRHAIEPATSSNAFTCKGAIGSARDDFAGWPGWGWSALVVFLASIRCSVWGHSGPHPGRLGFTSRRLSARLRSIGGPWQIGHTAGAISAAPQEVAVAAQLQGWMLAWGISGACQITSEHFGIDGGDCGEGPATVSLVAARPRRVLLLWCISGSRAIPGHSRAIHVPSSFLKAKGIERGWL